MASETVMEEKETEDTVSCCRLCKSVTRTIVNIDFKRVTLCDRCCLTITKQTVCSLSVRNLAGEDTGRTSICDR